MEVPQGYHSVLCTNCQKAKLQYRCLSWNPNNDHRFIPWSCDGCLPAIKEMRLDMGGKPVDMCEVCVASEAGAGILPTVPVYGISRAESTPDVSCTGCLELGAECEGLHIGSTRCMKCAQRGLDCDWQELNNTCGFCRTQHLRCVPQGDSCTNRTRCFKAMRESKQVQERLQSGSTCTVVKETVPDFPVKGPSDVKEATATLPAPATSPPKLSPVSTTSISRSDCSNCRQYGVVCNVGLHDSKCGRCEAQDITCDSRKTCGYCKTRRLRCSGQGNKCANCLRFGVECRLHEEQIQNIRMDVGNSGQTSRYTSVKDSSSANKPIAPPPQYNLSAARQLVETGVERTGCGNCLILGVSCSGLRTVASKCENCLAKDLNCDCKVKRRTCLYCRRRRLRCLGNLDSCGNCLRFGQECTQCPQPDRKPLDLEEIEKKRQHAEEKWQNAQNKRQYAPAQSPRDIVDGMSSTTSWQNCLSCKQDPLLRCDQDPSGCRNCKAKEETCQYPPLAIADELPETNTRYCTTCYRPKTRLTPGPLCHRCMKAAEAKATTVPEPCHACRIMNTKCDTNAESCAPCQKLNFKCLRGPSFSQRARYSTHCEPRSLLPAPPNPESSWSRYSPPSKPNTASSPVSPGPRWNNDSPPSELNGADSSASRSKFSDIAVRCNRGSTLGSAENTFKDLGTPPTRRNHPLIDLLGKCDHVEGTDSLCLCGRGRPETVMKSAADFMPPQPPSPLPLLTHVKTQDSVWQCKAGNDYCSDKVPCYVCRNPSTTAHLSRKKAQILPYCGSCRLLKVKCGGESPACARCKQKGLDCVYTIGPIIKLPKQGDVKQSAVDNCTIVEEQSKTKPAEQTPKSVAAHLPAEVEKAVAKAMEDLDMEEDWCMVTSDDVAAVTEEEVAEKTTGWGYKFW